MHRPSKSLFALAYLALLVVTSAGWPTAEEFSSRAFHVLYREDEKVKHVDLRGSNFSLVEMVGFPYLVASSLPANRAARRPITRI